jgi:hypothetical protein
MANSAYQKCRSVAVADAGQRRFAGAPERKMGGRIFACTKTFVTCASPGIRPPDRVGWMFAFARSHAQRPPTEGLSGPYASVM